MKSRSSSLTIATATTCITWLHFFNWQSRVHIYHGSRMQRNLELTSSLEQLDMSQRWRRFKPPACWQIEGRAGYMTSWLGCPRNLEHGYSTVEYLLSRMRRLISNSNITCSPGSLSFQKDWFSVNTKSSYLEKHFMPQICFMQMWRIAFISESLSSLFDGPSLHELNQSRQ